MVNQMKQHFCATLLSLGLCFSLLAQSVPARIDIVVIDGEGATTDVRQRVTRDPMVRVEDDDHRPLPGAVVLFALPASGTSAEFPSSSRTLTVVTDKNGQAAAHGLKTNDVPGQLQIYVTATFQGQRARTLINQTVQATAGVKVAKPELRTSKSGGKWKWVLLGVVAAGGAGAGVYFAHRNSTSAPVSIGTGAVVFGSPR